MIAAIMKGHSYLRLSSSAVSWLFQTASIVGLLLLPTSGRGNGLIIRNDPIGSDSSSTDGLGGRTATWNGAIFGQPGFLIETDGSALFPRMIIDSYKTMALTLTISNPNKIAPQKARRGRMNFEKFPK
jgi:hypothetical protein